MAELSGQQAAAGSEARPTAANHNVMDFMFGAQRLMLGEIAFAGSESQERARTETHLFSEFVWQLAGAHSVNGLKTMYEECGQHQVDFIRRDYERLFKHGKRMIEAASKLFSDQPDGWRPVTASCKVMLSRPTSPAGNGTIRLGRSAALPQ
jgi:hypothetical protein